MFLMRILHITAPTHTQEIHLRNFSPKSRAVACRHVAGGAKTSLRWWPRVLTANGQSWTGAISSARQPSLTCQRTSSTSLARSTGRPSWCRGALGQHRRYRYLRHQYRRSHTLKESVACMRVSFGGDIAATACVSTWDYFLTAPNCHTPHMGLFPHCHQSPHTHSQGERTKSVQQLQFALVQAGLMLPSRWICVSTSWIQ